MLKNVHQKWIIFEILLQVLRYSMPPPRLVADHPRLSYSELTPQTVNYLKINDKRCKGRMRTSIGSFSLYPSSGDGSAHADRLHLSAWLCDDGISRHAHGVARSPSSHILLVHLHASRLSRAQDLGRDGQMDASHPHRLALWTLAQSRLLERASPRELVGAGSRGYLARTVERHPVYIWRWQSRRQTRHQESCRTERAYQPASSLVFWPALRSADGRLGRLSHPRGLSAHSAQAPRRLSQ